MGQTCSVQLDRPHSLERSLLEVTVREVRPAQVELRGGQQPDWVEDECMGRAGGSISKTFIDGLTLSCPRTPRDIR